MNNVLEALSRIEMSWYDDMYSDRDDNLTYEDDIETIHKALVKLLKYEKELNKEQLTRKVVRSYETICSNTDALVQRVGHLEDIYRERE